MTPAVQATIRVRDLATDVYFNLPGNETALRVPYEAFHLDGPARYDGTLVEYEKNGERQQGRAAEASLGECRPGERVLVRDRALFKDPSGWWLCEVEAVNGGDIA